MQINTVALLLAATANADILDLLNSACDSVDSFVGQCSQQAKVRGVSNIDTHYTALSSALGAFGSAFKNCDSSEITDDFNSKFCDFESSLTSCLGSFNDWGNSFGGSSWVGGCSWGLWDTYWDICGDYNDKGDCKDLSAIWPNHHVLTSNFWSLSNAWDFASFGFTLYGYDDCFTQTSTCAVSTKPATSSAAVATTSSKASSSTKASSSPAEATTSSKVSAVDTTSAPTATGATGTTTYSTYTGKSSTYRCKVVGAAATNA